jgi:hypothetical protein
VDEIHHAYMREWSLDKFLTIDKIMVWYNGSYCPIHQYMPKKSEKWGIKFWILTDSVSKFNYCFEIYCRKNPEMGVSVMVPQAETNSAYVVAMKLLQGLKE